MTTSDESQLFKEGEEAMAEERWQSRGDEEERKRGSEGQMGEEKRSDCLTAKGERRLYFAILAPRSSIWPFGPFWPLVRRP